MKPSFPDHARPVEPPRRLPRRKRRARAYILIRLAAILCAADLLMLALWR